MLLLVARCSVYEPHVTAAVGQPFELRIGQVARLDNGAEVAFTDVLEDSRCPEGVQCIWAGDAVLRIGTRFGGGGWSEHLFRTSAPAAVGFGRHSLELLTVTPAPKPDQPVLREEYRAQLVVE